MEYFFLFFVPTVFVLLFILLAVLAKTRYRTYKSNKVLREIAEHSPYRRDKPLPKPSDDFLARNQEKEKAAHKETVIQQNKVADKELLQEGQVQIYDPLGLNIPSHDESQIVGLAEPQGFWSRFIMSQKLGYIMARLTQQNSKQARFWVNLIKAQAASQGKDQTRGR